MKFYFQLDGDIIRDAITYPHEGYTEVELDMTHLPAGINAGYYRWNGTAFEIDESLKPKDPTDVTQAIEDLQRNQQLMQQAIDDLVMGGAL
ncbi:hypothetical protein [Paenibacillus sp. UASWS1643]|uniref:hypothetical protein n=1 Tax=Paenibacillus sp. UASWS1643 TaxID=2580422 RepID=UPI0012397A78|nr:hypothetical protein [Paenibacillus sp. UASWS1643]KAA8747104.1 hypothetical protein FE296_23240 [Paenibacillus sp. UASWS1643]